MQYRKFGRLDWQPSALGFGCMRLPTVDGNPLSGDIDEAEAIHMIRYAIDQGVNYIDTAYPYHNGKSEVVVGKALQDGYREKVKLATKSPLWFVQETSDFDKYLNEQLEKLQTDHIDFYLLHGLNKHSWHNVVLKLNLLERAEAALKDGRIRHLGFSFHDSLDVFKEIVDGYDKWEFCQIQYNYMDIQHQAGAEGLAYAAAKGLAVIVMEPLLGGKLANPPQAILDVFHDFQEQKTPAEWALQWVWNQPAVSLLLSGMSTIEQVQQNLASASQEAVNSLSTEALAMIDQVRENYLARTAIGCTGCSYCMPCPNEVEIPKVFKMYNDGFMHQDVQTARSAYARFVGEKSWAKNCIQCKACEEKCPQQLPISDWMPKVHAVLGEGQSYETQEHK